MALTVYFARHAAAANPRDILYGRLPGIDLSEQGQAQAAALAAAMSALPLQAIYHSPLLRARRTAAVIAADHRGVPLRRSTLLLENRHPYQGRSHAEVAKLGDRAYDPDVLGQEGETIVDLRNRLIRFLRRAGQRHPGGVVAAVAHADPLAALRAHLLGKDLTVANLRQEAPPLASVFRVEIVDSGEMRLDWFWKPAEAAVPAASANGAGPGEARIPQSVEAPVSSSTRTG